jgi:hypothetical protein
MRPTIISNDKWAQLEFSMVELGDLRRTRRLVTVAQGLAQCPRGTLPQSFDRWKELKGAYRLFSNAEVSYEKIIGPHWEHTQQECRNPGEYLMIEDRTDLDYSSHRATQGLGRIGNDRGRGLMLHTTLAVRVESWQLDQTPAVSVMGLLDQQCWARKGTSRRGQKEQWRQRMSRERESQYWARIVKQMGPPPSQAHWIYLADRESDIYEVLEDTQDQGWNSVVRAQHDRALADQDQHLFKTVAQSACLGRFQLEIRNKENGGKRVAQIEVRSTQVTLRGVWRPGGNRPDRNLNVVEAREINAPDGVKPVLWILLTDLPCRTFVEARRIIALYARRWLIEEYHKALKSGANVQESQLETADRLKALLGVLAVVAVRLLQTKLLARTHPDEIVSVENIDPEALQILSVKYEKPPGGWTNATLLIAIARLGGFIGRRSDGLPGWQTIWRGWQRLMIMVDGIHTLAPDLRLPRTKRCG